MKFKIKFADQIVGVLSIIAIAALIFLMFFIGSKQKWFVPKHHFYTRITSGSNVSEGMSIQYKGFGIGKVESIDLLSPEEIRLEKEKDYEVKVSFYVSDEYIDKVRTGSVIEIAVSPIGLGSSINFHPGNGEGILEDESFIPEKSSEEGKLRIKNKDVTIPTSVDSITTIIGSATTLVNDIDALIVQINGILSGESDSELVQTITEITNLIAGVNKSLSGDTSVPIGQVLENLKLSTQTLEKMLSDIQLLTSDPQGLVPKLIESEQAKGTIDQALGKVKDISSSVNSEMPQISLLIAEIQTILKQVEDVVASLQNIGIINKGLPERTEASGVTPKLREEEF
ncbi:MAG: MlaD family protein [Treponema sp.]|nr:MlaD family protein [Treponema sp.]